MILVDRHKTALKRDKISLPLRLAISKGLLKPSDKILDYGCGRGDDVNFLKNLGFNCIGWDPHYFKELDRSIKVDFVNLGFVINVIEVQTERIHVLKDALHFADKVLLVSCMLNEAFNQTISTPYNDGFLSSNKTFQKFFSQSELREFLEANLNKPAIALGAGVFAIFLNEERFSEFEYLKISQDLETENKIKNDLKELNFSFTREHKSKLKAKNEVKKFTKIFFQHHGRIPALDEVNETFDKKKQLKASEYKLISNEVSKSLHQYEITSAHEARKKGLIIQFCSRKFMKLRSNYYVSKTVQRDIRSLFGSQKNLIQISEKNLFSVGKNSVIEKEVETVIRSGKGFLLGNKFLFHRRDLENVSLKLRILISIGDLLSGELNEADVFQINLENFKVIGLIFFDFNSSAVPKFKRRVKVDLRSGETFYTTYSEKENIRLFLFKSHFMLIDDPMFEKQQCFENELKTKTNLKDEIRSWDIASIYNQLTAANISIPHYGEK